MHSDVSDLIEFYDRPMGAQVRRLLAHRIRARWRDVRGLTVIGLGYAAPYLGMFRGEAARLGAFMPAEQGYHRWPAEGAVQSVLADEVALPLPDATVDRLMAIHLLETTNAPRQALREIWRVLSPEGKLLLVVPNRRGVWARWDSTPFGSGQPYSRGQIERLLTGGMFAVDDCSFALSIPPLRSALLWRQATTIERVGSAVWPVFSGVIIVEASKQMVGTITKLKQRTIRARLRPAVAVKTSAARLAQSRRRAAG